MYYQVTNKICWGNIYTIYVFTQLTLYGIYIPYKVSTYVHAYFLSWKPFIQKHLQCRTLNVNSCNQTYNRLRYVGSLWKYSFFNKVETVYAGRLKVILLLQKGSYDFEPTWIILFLICRVLPDQPERKEITKPLTNNKYLSLLYFWL